MATITPGIPLLQEIRTSGAVPRTWSLTEISAKFHFLAVGEHFNPVLEFGVYEAPLAVRNSISDERKAQCKPPGTCLASPAGALGPCQPRSAIDSGVSAPKTTGLLMKTLAAYVLWPTARILECAEDNAKSEQLQVLRVCCVVFFISGLCLLSCGKVRRTKFHEACSRLGEWLESTASVDHPDAHLAPIRFQRPPLEAPFPQIAYASLRSCAMTNPKISTNLEAILQKSPSPV